MASILTGYAMFFYEPDDCQGYIPKSQRSRYNRLMAQWSLVLKSWLKQGFEKMEMYVFNLKTRKKHSKMYSMATKHSSFSSRSTRLLALQAVAMSATANASYNHQMFDTDSCPVGIDNRCSACISHKIEDFIDTPMESSRVIKGIGGSMTSNVKMVTILWKWEGDN